MKTCESPVRISRHTPVHPCGKPAYYKWTPRSHPERAQFMCKACGELTAGNYKDELTVLAQDKEVATGKEPK